jgi:hypothetical protein
MGNFKITTKFNFILIIVLLFASCNKNKYDLSESNQDYHLSKSIENLEESENFIETSKEFELKHNELFQQDLQAKSKEYYDNLIDTFVDEETGFFKLFGEIWDFLFKSKNERKLLWKLKIERNFRTTSYLTFIRNELTVYTDGINNQRKNGVSKVLGVKHNVSLYLPIIEANSFNTNSETVDKLVRKINDEIKDQLIDIFIDSVVSGVILGILGCFAVVSSIFKKQVGCMITILFFIFFAIRSYNRQHEMKDVLRTDCYKTLNSTKIDYLDELNKNTIIYYSQLQKINYESNK